LAVTNCRLRVSGNPTVGTLAEGVGPPPDAAVCVRVKPLPDESAAVPVLVSSSFQ